MARRRTRKVRGYRATKRKTTRKRKPARRRSLRAVARRSYRRTRAVVRRRRTRRNPKGILSTPAVRIGVAGAAGVGVGLGLDAMAKPSWWPSWLSWLPMSTLVGLVVGGVAYRNAKGTWREVGLAAGVGCLAAPVVTKVGQTVGQAAIGGPVTKTAAMMATKRFSLPQPKSSVAAAMAHAGVKSSILH